MLDEDIRIDKEDLVNSLYNSYFKNTKFRNLHLYKEALSCILGNLVVNGNRNKPLSKPLVKNSRNRSQWFKQVIIDNILSVLVENDFCLKWDGFWGQSTKYFLTTKLIYEHFKIKTTRPTTHIYMDKIDPTDKRRISKSRKRRLNIKAKRNSLYKKMSKDLDFINELLCEATVKFEYDPLLYNRPEYEEQLQENLVNCGYLSNNGFEYEIDKNSLYLRRKFNRGDYRCGGRFYTKIFQSIPSNVRQTITINDEATVELDFSAHHLRLLYHKEGIDFKGEVYIYNKSDEENADKRLIHKMIAMIAINAETRQSAILAVWKTLKDDKKTGKFNSTIPTLKQLNELYDDFLGHHKPIAKYVGADVGIRLQRIDSDIMNDILVELTNKQIVALPIHDSIIVQSKFSNTLKLEMIIQYNKYTNYDPIIE
jgi:hypothetical protein